LGEFDASKIGTGEGAQAYGYGIYTAEAPAVAKEYQRQLGTQMEYKGKQFYDPIVGRKTGTTGNTEIDDYLLSYLGDTGVIRKELLNAAKEMRLSNNPQALKEYQTLMSEFRKIRPDVTAANTGNLYKVDLPDEKIATMLDWDSSLSQQSPQVKEAINNLPEFVAYAERIMGKPINTLNGGTIQKMMLGYQAELNKSSEGASALASEAFRKSGISGIKYLDKASKEVGEGTRNFVVFPNEEKIMTILERNGMPATPIESPAFTDPFGNTIGSSIR
jgi:uncharacterized phage infection (PIP) family protein YhgE